MKLATYLHDRTGIFAKVLIANAAIVLVGGLAAMAVSRYFWHGDLPGTSVELVFLFSALVVTVGVNYALLRVSFRPLFLLQATLDRVRQGDFSARVPESGGDPSLARLTAAANLMLDRLAGHRQAMAAQVLTALEEERKRISRELHDETSQSLTSVMVNLDVIEKHLAGCNEELAGRVRLTKEIAKRTLDETRRLMFDLRPSVLDDLGLVPALRWFVSQRVHPMGLRVDFQAEGLEQRLPEELETALFRIIQEAMTNVVKHARAKHVEVRLAREPGCITGVVRDDGIGFHPVQLAGRDEKERGMGLFNMQERAALVGGSVRLESAPGHGTTMRVTVPDRLGGQEAGGKYPSTIG